MDRFFQLNLFGKPRITVIREIGLLLAFFLVILGNKV